VPRLPLARNNEPQHLIEGDQLAGELAGTSNQESLRPAQPLDDAQPDGLAHQPILTEGAPLLLSNLTRPELSQHLVVFLFVFHCAYSLNPNAQSVNPSKRFFELFSIGILPSTDCLRVGWSRNSPAITPVVSQGVGFFPFDTCGSTTFQGYQRKLLFAVAQKVILFATLPQVVVNPPPSSLQIGGVFIENVTEFDLSVFHFVFHCAYSLTPKPHSVNPLKAFFLKKVFAAFGQGWHGTCWGKVGMILAKGFCVSA